MTRKPQIASALLVAGLLAGCGSSTHVPSTPSGATGPNTATSATSHGPPIASRGPVGKVGPGASGTFNASNSAVLFHIRIALVKFFTSKGFYGVTAQCSGVNSSTASCNVNGSNKANQTSSAVLTLSVDQSNGLLRITHVT